ncbi:SDR family NAD(P)-dependent oxidoreductase [Gracilimonas tropica]|uniref:SDR family NAD(P)-dependent oxidoreductase n=1 Tax=Gracilimonas tropica TaxID=454600 RepID=UPI00037A7B44|nr:SDR family oxidoreductase [Gracilimonas tropica]
MSTPKTALVTGGTKGIGKAIVKKLLQSNYKVVINYAHSDEVANSFKKELDQEGLTNHVLIKYNNADLENVTNFAAQVGNEVLDYLDVVIFNAGLTYKSTLGDFELHEWKKVFYVNVHFPVFFLNAIMPYLNKESNTIFISSLMAIHPHSTSLAYGVSKKAVIGLVENLVKELTPDKGRVNGIAPGFVNTEWHNRKSEELIEKIKSKISLNAFCDPAEVASLCMHIISNNYLNGSIIKLDGGYSFQ